MVGIPADIASGKIWVCESHLRVFNRVLSVDLSSQPQGSTVFHSIHVSTIGIGQEPWHNVQVVS